MTPSILITGCSTGIGLSAALSLKARGYRVFAGARKIVDVEKLTAQGLESVQLDVTDQTSMQKALAHIVQLTGGTLDALFNNAGYLEAGAIEDLTPAQEHAQFATNVFGPMELIRLVLPLMRKQGHGRIIQNSSILGIITLPYYGAYNASKFALEGFSLTLRQELYGSNIFVSLINPGPITSQLRANAFELYQKSVLQKKESVHKNTYQQMEKSYFHPSKKDRDMMQTPDAVVKNLIHALESKQPKIHYYVGAPAKIMALLHKLLPERWLEKILMQIARRK